MKKIVLFLFFLASIHAYAQKKNLGVGTPAPNPNAALHVESPTNDQGFIMPRLTTVQRTSLATVLTATDNGLMLYDTDLKTIYIWDGATWKNSAQVAGGNRLSYPYKDSVTTALTGNDVLALKYNNAAAKRVLRVESLHPANGSSAVSVLQNGTGIGIFSQVNNASAGTSAIYGTTNSNLGGQLAPVGVYGESTGTGSVAGSFRINNASNTFPALYSETNGTGPAARINASNANSTAPALEVINSGKGNALQTTGKIQAGQFIGDGSGVTNVKSIGLSYPFKDSVTSTLTGNDLFALKYNNGAAKRVLRVESLNPANGSSAVSVLQNGTGIGIFSQVNNASAGTSAIYGTTNSNLGGQLAPVGVYGESTGTGSVAGSFRINNASNTFPALYSETNGTGPAARINASNANSAAPALEIIKSGTGNALQTTGKIQAGQFIGDGSLLTGIAGGKSKYVITDPASIDTTLTAKTFSNQPHGFAISAIHKGTGDAAGFFLVDNATSTFPALYGENRGNGSGLVGNVISGTGNAVTGFTSGNGGNGGFFGVTNTTSNRAGLYGFTQGFGPAVMGETTTGFTGIFGVQNGAAGNAGFFNNTNAANASPVIQINNAGTGNAIQTGGKIQAGQFIGDGSQLANLPSAKKIQFPLTDTLTNIPDTGSAIKLVNNNTAVGSFGLINLTNLNPNSNYSPLFIENRGLNGATDMVINNSANTNDVVGAITNGLGRGGFFNVNNTANNSSALYSQSNGTGNALQAVNTGLGTAARFSINNATNTVNALAVTTNGTGSAANFSITNPLSTPPGVNVNTAAQGGGIRSTSTGTGYAGWFETTSATNNQTALRVDAAGTASAGSFSITNVTNTASALSVNTAGTGLAGEFRTTNPANNNATLGAESNSNTAGSTAVGGRMTGTGGNAGYFEINNTASESSTLYAVTNGTGNAIAVRGLVTNTANTLAAVYGSTAGTGTGVYGITTGAGAAIQGYTTTGSIAVYGRHDGATNGNAGRFDITNAGNASPALQVSTIGNGFAGTFTINNATNSNAAVAGGTNGTGGAGAFAITNTANVNNAVYGTTNGPGTGGYFSSTSGGIGNAAKFVIANAANIGSAFQATTNGLGKVGDLSNTNASNTSTALNVTTNGIGGAGYFDINNTSSNAAALIGTSNSNTLTSGGAGVLGQSTGTGAIAGAFRVNNTGNSNTAVYIETNGVGGTVLNLNHIGTNGNIAVLRSASVNVARIDKTGIGYFNGGTQSSGADVAEMFDIEGARTDYEPGDVLVISEATDRTVEKSSSPSSTKVAGVYATKPGVTLTEKGIDESLDSLVPMGVIGVIPTKVCLENGPIKRGDLLVTSSKQGHAMKAIPVNVGGVLIYPTGAILGKALENFEGQEAGLIKVLVNVK